MMGNHECRLFRNPNFLTMCRVAASPAIVALLSFSPNRATALLAAAVFSAAAISDYFDGYFARQYGLTSTFGKIMDPVADKLVVSCSLIMLTSVGWIDAWIVCVIIGRELAVTGLRVAVMESGEDVSASWLGKYKTGFQIAAIIPLLMHYPFLGINWHGVGMVFLWGALIFTLWSGADYFLRFRKSLDL